ncbi:MAG: hypothetical protein ACJ70U_05940 [Nitrososphaera sp.]
MKFENRNIVLALMFGFVTLSSATTFAGGTFATNNNNNNTTSSDNEAIDLGDPFYAEHYQTDVEKPRAANMSITDNFTGNGVINGTLPISVQGSATETFRNNETYYIQGTSKFETDSSSSSGGVAFYNFTAIDTYNPDGTFESRGAAVFDGGATGELTPLSNTVAIYKNRVDSNGNGTFLMWHWK